ncbi:D-isomer specific 2-hydroxyacid dehydrogenase [Trametes versicolor FP-101664 SS1]|uniref:D-isomer specific 2-hydroxyacid dehydrogenase n=1 Tax=Trametes versicolor (strain FP-101664) TaxID=717944 RepID=UPI000462206C|nr:D-isomer specific 2-hydroxyacid dehydrogenase [Trametes versicolor FP-101664 SS1]EIW64322.1 D-isomer specific 2-hydroxyacid dehydrogenase [Trametes versicolor FP-101664 SS1]
MSERVRVAILDDYQNVAFKFGDWSGIRDRLIIDSLPDTTADEDVLAKRLEPYTIVCAMRERTKFRASLLDRLPNLRLIATTGMRNLGIDVAYAKTKGVTVVGTGGKGDSTLEHIWAIILATVRHIVVEDARTKASAVPWQSTIPTGLGGKTLGLLGVGRLGSETGRIAKAFGMEVIGWSPNLTPERAASAGVTFIPTKEELFRRSDVLSVQIVLSERTHHIIKAADLALLKPTAFFINTSRGPLVDEAALIEVLKEKRIAGAGLDVFDEEPLPLDHPLRKLPNVTISPHMGYVSDENYGQAFWSQTVENIAAFLDGRPTRVMG